MSNTIVYEQNLVDIGVRVYCFWNDWQNDKHV